ncbi:ESX secretion-associated protein EspG [Nocardia uniformis]|uniref:ESX secretion-associated protein EspG n=1 Tax=Nocardia uniformis TaxID=53432 RepID=A0A849C0T4_9NOCA|nr:ESX secretion-associated protein EspG [Nocardia uniformis]NNH69467.1 ESX secretion-associated protein EspG [Nocardia uniformis]
MRTWRFSEVGFSVLWKERTGDRLPAPFLYTSTAATQREYREEQEETRNRVRANTDHEVIQIVDVVSSPDLYLTVRGGDQSDPASLIRLRASRKGGRGYLITQLPGESIYHRGGYTVTECDPLRLADAVVAALPEAEPGRRGDLGVVASDGYVDGSYRSPIASAGNSPSVLRGPATIAGTIDVRQGSSVFGPRGIVHHTVRWRDLAEDGRYVVAGSPAAAMAVDSKRFVGILNSQIAKVIAAIKEERERSY